MTTPKTDTATTLMTKTDAHEENLKMQLSSIKKLRKVFDGLPRDVRHELAGWVARNYSSQLPPVRD